MLIVVLFLPDLITLTADKPALELEVDLTSILEYLQSARSLELYL